MILADGQLYLDGCTVQNMRLQDLLSQQLTLTISMYKGLIMRSFVDNGRKATNYFPLEEIQTGLDLTSAPMWMFWVDGLIQEAYSSLMLVVGETKKLASVQLCH
ncbi:hypothetical protein K1719_039396 [Acacia pycnantha]|nr:hypothetical protein K1719_039396 [Acacia pycnantha]